MSTYHGSCHCGRVTFAVDADISRVLDCNCSLCRKKGALYHPFIDPEQFQILSGEDALSMYQFNTMVAEHYFCKYCGIHLFHRHRVDPSKWGINVRSLDDVDLSALAVVPLDRANDKVVENLKNSYLKNSP